MVTIAQPSYSLPTNPSVKWLATQERNLNRELPYPDTAAETTEEYVFRTYLQFLWLPQSIMPLQFLVPALSRVTGSSSSPSTSQSPAAHPLHSLLKPILLTSRASAQKHHERIPRILAEENEPTDSEEEYLWYAYHKDKIGEDDQPQDGQDEYEAQERLKAAWLERFERREVQIQIILHFLLVSLPGDRVAPTSEDARQAIAESLPLPPPLSPSKSKKRKRKQKAAEPPPQPLEERLESYMDKLAMWQLMHSVDSTLSRGDAPKTAGAKGKEKERKQKDDDRDWMQAFCEDVVEPLFKEKSPELCALFRSKLFPDAGNSDTDTLRLSPPPLSSKAAAKRLRSSVSSAAASRGKTAASTSTAKSKDADLRARSRSLSMSLEQEKKERSRSLSVGPNGLRKRGTMFEVTMTTKFSKKKGELERTASVPALPPGPSLSRTQSQTLSADHQGSKAAQRGEKSSMGSVLVAATPVKPRTESSRAQSQSQRTQSQSRSQTQTRLPALFAGSSLSSSSAGVRTKVQVQPSRLSRVDSLNIDTDDDDDEDEDPNGVATPTRTKRQRTISCSSEDPEDNEWKLAGSPDVLFLGASGSQEWHSSGDEGPPVSSSPPGDLGGFGDVERTPVRAGNGRGRVLVGDTPTKAR